MSKLKRHIINVAGVWLAMALSPPAATAQGPERVVIFQDSFDANANGWLEGSDSIRTVYLDGGRYLFEHKRNESAWLIWNNAIPPLGDNDDFEIACTVAHVSGMTDRGFGLIWGGADTDNFYYFRVTADGHFRYGVFRMGEETVRCDWRPTDLLKTGAQSNLISVSKAGEEITLLINGVGVFYDRFDGFFGPKIGFSVENRMKVAFDDLRISTGAGASDEGFCGVLLKIDETLREDFTPLVGDVIPDREDGRFYECRVALPGTFGAELIHEGYFVTCLFFCYAGSELSEAQAQFDLFKTRVFACLGDSTDESSDMSKGVLRYVGFYSVRGDKEYTCSVSLEAMGDDYVTLVELSRDSAE